MGAVTSSCKRKKRSEIIRIIRDNYTQTEIPTANTFNNKVQHSFIKREFTNSASNCYHQYSSLPRERYSKSTKHMHQQSVCSTPPNISYRRPKSYVAQPFHCKPTPVSSSVPDPRYSQAAMRMSRTDLHRGSSASDIIHDTSEYQHQAKSYRKLTRVVLSKTMDNNEEFLTKQNDRSHVLQHSASTPIDMFLIDLSNEHVLINQPVSMNIRHLRSKTLENLQTHSTVVNTQENLLNYIPSVCEKYPNPTQPMRNTLYVRVPQDNSRE